MAIDSLHQVAALPQPNCEVALLGLGKFRPGEPAPADEQALFGVAWNDPLVYDLVLNLTQLTIEGAGAFIVQSAGLPEFTPTPASLRTLQDLAVQSRVVTALARDRRTRETVFEVRAYERLVTITGTAHSSAIIGAVPKIAAQTEGTKEVRSAVRLLHEGAPVTTPPSSVLCGEESDGRIAAVARA